MNAENSETRKARKLGFGMQIPELLAQRKFVSVKYLYYQIYVTHLKGQKGNRDMQAAKRD